MREEDIDPADCVFRLAFGTFFGLKDPLSFHGDGDLVRPRWRADPEAAYMAEEAAAILDKLVRLPAPSV